MTEAASGFLHGVASGDPTSTHVVILSGDVHLAPGAELAEEPSMPPVAVELVNTSLTSQNLDDKMGWGARTDSIAIEEALLAGMPHLRYVDLDSHGYSIVDVDRDRVRFEWWTVEGIDRRVSGHALAAAMSVRHGEPRLVVADPVPTPVVMPAG